MLLKIILVLASIHTYVCRIDKQTYAHNWGWCISFCRLPPMYTIEGDARFCRQLCQVIG